jgi:glycosyltransferase involved in cell wall biosynthesis
VKIIVVHNQYREPGGEDVAFAQERELLKRGGHEVVSYCRTNDEAKEYSGLQQLHLLKQVVWAQDTYREISSLLRRERPHLVHVHNTFMMVSPSVYAACFHAQVPVVQTLHNYRLLCPAGAFFRDGKACEECADHSLWRSVRYSCYRESRIETSAVALMLAVHRNLRTWTRVDCYIALTEFTRQKFVQGGLPPDKVVVKPNFVPSDPGKKEERGEYALFVGRLSDEKGVKTLLRAWECLHYRIPLILVGDGPLGPQLRAESERHNPSNIIFRGHVTRDQTIAAIKGARFLILPSDCYENFPLSIAEAFSCGTAVICSRLGAMQEIVNDGRTGLHFKAGDPHDLSVKVEWAWSRPDLTETMGREARADYESKYTPERNYQLLMAIYERAMASPRRRGSVVSSQSSAFTAYANRCGLRG